MPQREEEEFKAGGAVPCEPVRATLTPGETFVAYPFSPEQVEEAMRLEENPEKSA